MPNSILWTGLVVLWLFVLFPMLADRHPRIRQTTDAALATRVLHRGGSKRKLKSRRAVGHDSDPDWDLNGDSDWEHTRHDYESSDDYGVEDAGRVHVSDAGGVYSPDPGRVYSPDPGGVYSPDPGGVHPSRRSRGGFDPEAAEFVPDRRGRGGFDPEADALARSARYSFRQRAVLGLVLTAVVFGALGTVASTGLWAVSGAALGVLFLYLVYLRRQVRLEEDIRRRRMARAARPRYADELPVESSVETSRPEPVRRAGAVVLEADDEDPVFEHLDTFDVDRHRGVDDGPAAEIRRAVGQ